MMSEESEKLGADGLLLVTPYYNKATQDGLYAHYRKIASATKLPCIIYNVPSRTGTNILPETVAKLAADKGMDTKYIMEVCSMKYEFHAVKLISAARGFSLQQLKRAVEICAETDFLLKSSGQNDRELMKDAVLRIAAGETGA